MKILAGNWKLFKTRKETTDFFNELKVSGLFPEKASVKHILCPSPTLLESAAKSASILGIEIFSQNCSWAKSGAFTGEMSPEQLKDVGATGTLVGHSERRQYFGDTDESVLKRALGALEAGLKVIYCVGESFDQRQSGQTLSVLNRQIEGLRREILPHANPSQFILAYEPVWAIGTGLVADTPQIEEAHGYLAKELEKSGKNGWKILYGGSVKPDNLGTISKIAAVEGALVGGASLDPKTYLQLRACLG